MHCEWPLWAGAFRCDAMRPGRRARAAGRGRTRRRLCARAPSPVRGGDPAVRDPVARDPSDGAGRAEPSPGRTAEPDARLTPPGGRGSAAAGRSPAAPFPGAIRPRADADLAHQLAGRGDTIVVIGSRKGGVGKTSFAAGIAIAAGTVLDQIGHMACIVDANIANPDAWGR